MGKVSKDDKIKLLESKVSLLEAEVLLKDELLDFMQAGIDELTEKVKELGGKAKYFEPEEVSIMPAECQQNDSKLLADCKHDAILKRNEKETETKGRESVGFAADDNDNVRLMETFKMLKSATTGR